MPSLVLARKGGLHYDPHVTQPRAGLRMG